MLQAQALYGEKTAKMLPLQIHEGEGKGGESLKLVGGYGVEN